MGVAGATGLWIAPAGRDELPGGDPSATVPPDAEAEYGCHEIDAAFPGSADPERLGVATPGGKLPPEAGDIEGEEVANVGVDDGDMPAPI